MTAPAATTDREAALAAAIARLAADEPADVVTPPWGGLRERLLAALGPHTLIGPSAARIGIAVLIGVGLGRALGLSHAYWIGLTATAVLQGSNFSHVRGRFVSRVAGTVAGVALAFALLAAHPSLLVVAVIAALLQVYIEVLVVVSYGLAVVGITIMSMLLFHVGAPQLDVGSALGARLLDTAIGAVLALVLRRLLWHRSTGTRLPAAQQRVLTAVADLLAARWASGTESRQIAAARHQLHTDLASLRALANDTLVDFADYEAGGTATAPGLTPRIEELAYVALSWPATSPPATAQALDFVTGVRAASEAVRGGAAPQPVALPAHPRTGGRAERCAAVAARVTAGLRSPRG